MENDLSFGALYNRFRYYDATTVLQAHEPWRETRMAEAVRTFEACLLDGLAGANKEELAGRTRVAVAIGQLNIEF